jgi:HSP20 family protein
MSEISELRHGVEEMWGSLTHGWQRLRERAAGAFTRFRPGRRSPARGPEETLPSVGWALLAGDVYEDARKIVVRLEIPGMEKTDFEIDVHDDLLWVRGEKRLERESTEGAYRVLQCAYGSFERSIPLPTGVIVDQAAASYRNGVLRIELPKSESTRPKAIELKVR